LLQVFKRGEEHTPAGYAMAQWLLHAPDALKQELFDQALGNVPGLPGPAGYLADGEPVYDTRALAAALGISTAEALSVLRDAERAGLPVRADPALVSLVQ
jgi:hypothetical protein